MILSIEKLGFSEALRAAWLMQSTRQQKLTFIISRENGEKLYHGTNGYEMTYKVNGQTLKTTWSILAPDVSCYWLDSNEWTLTVEL